MINVEKLNTKVKLAAIEIVEEGMGGFLANPLLVQLRKDGLISATPIQTGRRGRPELEYQVTGKAKSFRNLARNWK
jgi:DNA-binding PadR family transcriptional regulator